MQVTKSLPRTAPPRAKRRVQRAAPGDARPRRGVDSREKILRAAERLFADHGYDACSFRMIAADSGINQGLLHYYFGTKQNLFREVFLRGARLVAERRSALLDEAEAAAGDAPVGLETLVRCFIEPPLRMLQQGPSARAFVRIHSQLRNEPQDFGLALRREAFEASTRRFVDAMARACPELPPRVVYWRFSFMIGAYLVVVSQSGRLEDFSAKACNLRDIEAAIEQMVPFIVAGWRAAAPDPS